MREITSDEIVRGVQKLYTRAQIMLPPDVAMAVECAWEIERLAEGRAELDRMMDAFNQASRTGSPLCPVAGSGAVWLDVGRQVRITGGGLEAAVSAGLGAGNVSAIYTRPVAGERMDITLLLCGTEGEPPCVVGHFTAETGTGELARRIAEAVCADGTPDCYPIVVGIGLGSTAEQCALAAGRALVRPLDRRSGEPRYAELEAQTLSQINRTGIGPGAVGGSTTALAVNVEPAQLCGEPLLYGVRVGAYPLRRARMVL